MSDRVKCHQCDRMPLIEVANANGGLCMFCFKMAESEAAPRSERTFSGKYDDASWHYGGDFPSELSTSAGATHIGMFVASCIFHGLAGSLHTEEFPEDLQRLQDREITPGAWIIEACDEKFTHEELNDEGNAFAMEYYYADEAQYLADYENTLCRKLPSAYHVEDTWNNFQKIDKVITKRLHMWRNRLG